MRIKNPYEDHDLNEVTFNCIKRLTLLHGKPPGKSGKLPLPGTPAGFPPY
jgi:hypothetical protein